MRANALFLRPEPPDQGSDGVLIETGEKSIIEFPQAVEQGGQPGPASA